MSPSSGRGRRPHLLLVRHAVAYSRSAWEGDDLDRPLTKSGHAQARRLVSALAELGPRRVLSSPYLRCVQTVQPLADQLGLPVEIAGGLAEGDPDLALDLVRALAGAPVAVCTHGDVVPVVLSSIAEKDGVALPKRVAFDKGSAWVLETTPEGSFRSASYLPPKAGKPRKPAS